MYSSPTMVDAFDALGVIAPECGECERSGAVAYTHGLYEHLRECDACRVRDTAFPARTASTERARRTVIHADSARASLPSSEQK
jgi:predicted anti-sigma-YlaC factor YlaD